MKSIGTFEPKYSEGDRRARPIDESQGRGRGAPPQVMSDRSILSALALAQHLVERPRWDAKQEVCQLHLETDYTLL